MLRVTKNTPNIIFFFQKEVSACGRQLPGEGGHNTLYTRPFLALKESKCPSSTSDGMNMTEETHFDRWNSPFAFLLLLAALRVFYGKTAAVTAQTHSLHTSPVGQAFMTTETTG